MANDIYSTTHDGLSKLVSPRVASRVLENALRKRKLDPESITAKQMKSLLRGPILNDLKGTLPQAGLKHSLQRLSKTVTSLKRAPTLVGALDAPEPWDDTPPLNAPNASQESETTNGSDLNVVLEESPPPPAKTNLPSVSLSKTGETSPSELSFDPEPAVAAKLTDTPAGSRAGTLTATPASEMAVVEPETQDHLATAQVNLEEEHAEGEESLSLEHSSGEELELSQTDSYGTPLDSAISEPALAVEPELLVDAETQASVYPSLEAELFDTNPVTDTVSSDALVESAKNGVKLDEETLDEVVLQFAQLDHVRMVATLLDNGTVAHSRGSGFDLATLSRLGTLGLKLLARSGELRSYYLSFKEGQLFFFPLAGYTLCIIGTTELNLGLVFATFQKLEEDV